MSDRFEAFFAVECEGALGPTSYRTGYRCCETGKLVCALELPASIVEAAILKNAKLTVTVTPDGHVRSRVCGIAFEHIAASPPFTIEPIDRLISQSVTAENLHLEEITFADLDALLRRLQCSIALVQEAMKHLADYKRERFSSIASDAT